MLRPMIRGDGPSSIRNAEKGGILRAAVEEGETRSADLRPGRGMGWRDRPFGSRSVVPSLPPPHPRPVRSLSSLPRPHALPGEAIARRVL